MFTIVFLHVGASTCIATWCRGVVCDHVTDQLELPYSTLFSWFVTLLSLMSYIRVSWCSWWSRQSHTLKVSGSSPDEANLCSSNKSHLLVVLEYWNKRFSPQTPFKKRIEPSVHMWPALRELTWLAFTLTFIVWSSLCDFCYFVITWL